MAQDKEFLVAWYDRQIAEVVGKIQKHAAANDMARSYITGCDNQIVMAKAEAEMKIANAVEQQGGYFQEITENDRRIKSQETLKELLIAQRDAVAAGKYVAAVIDNGSGMVKNEAEKPTTTIKKK